MTYDLLLEALDTDKIVEAIHAVSLKQCDYEDCIKMVLKSIRKWGPSDYLNFSITGIEERFSVEFPESGGFIPHVGINSETSNLYGPRSVKGFVDLVGSRAGVAGSSPVVEVVDYKTTGSISSDQQDRVRYSWQGRLYATVYGAQRVVFRSIQRDGRAVELRYDWPTKGYCDQDVCEYFGQALNLRETFRHQNKWLQHAPSACKAYGKDCPYRSICLVNNQAPRKLIELRPFSFSGSEAFLLCPEKYRLNTVLDLDKGNDETDLGSAFHAGVQEAWTQINKLQGA